MVTRNFKIGCGTIALILLFGLCYFSWSQRFIHDWYLWQFARSYSHITHPPTTQHVKSYKQLGLLIGNGNHIDLFVGEVRSYSGSCQQIIDWYDSRDVPSQLAHGERVPIEIVFVDNNRISSSESDYLRPFPIGEIVRDIGSSHSTNLHYYIVYVLDATGYPPGFDIRGM